MPRIPDISKMRRDLGQGALRMRDDIERLIKVAQADGEVDVVRELKTIRRDHEKMIKARGLERYAK